ncbi:uncharacterized protein [Hetaerina americana]|uniref:uncharacterized protein n=1 Tax=Hetaerina americana TaxID=62018 RepID=UPI003A7F5D0B
MENLHAHQHSMLLKTLDFIHPPCKVNLQMALEKMAYTLCKNKLYEESAEYFLDLLALLEINGPATVFRYHLHNAVAVLLLLSENSDIDRTKEAICLCDKAAKIFQNISGIQDIPKFSLYESDEDGPSANKRPKLELEVQSIFAELDRERTNADQMNLTGNLDNCDSIRVTSFENDDSTDELHSDSIYASLMFSEHDLMSCILLSECAFRENDFSRSLVLLNRCLQRISKHQVLERSKNPCRDGFLKTTDFILSKLWLKKAQVLMQKESVSGINFSRDIEHCFRSARLRNPDNADIKYHHITYLMRSEKREEIDMNEILPIVEGKTNFDGINHMSAPNLAIWFIFRCQVTKEEFENLKDKVKQLE